MVRVLHCHHFAGQEVFSTSHEPVTLCSSGQWLFVASVQCCIHVHDLHQPRCPCVVHMPTIALPKQILHCQKGNYLAVLEEKFTRHSSTPVVSVRLYLQWEKASSTTPMKIKFAGNIHRGYPDALEIVEVPLHSHDPVFITCCPATGNFAIAGHKLVKIYEVVEHIGEDGTPYKDVEPVLDVRFSIIIKEVALCEEFVAVSSQSEVQVVRLHDRDLEVEEKLRSSLKSDLESTSSDSSYRLRDDTVTEILRDSECVEWDCAENESPTQLNSQGQESTIMLQSKKMLDSQTIYKDVEILGPTMHEVVCHPITIWYDGCVMQEGTVTTYLYRSFVLRDDDDFLHSLQFVPLYRNSQDEGAKEKSEQSNGVLQSSRRSDLIGLCAFCSTTSVGYLYNILNTTELLATYPYTVPSMQVAVTNRLVYSVTKIGLEIYTSRGYAKALHNVNAFNDVTETCPPTSLDICLIGVQPFMVIQSLSVSEDHLVVMSKVTSPRNESVNSSIYAVTNCKTEDLVRDMMGLGSKHHHSSPPAYLQLLQEACLCLRGHMLEYGASNKEITTLYADVCALLGDYYARCASDEESQLTLPYYLMTGFTPERLISRLTAKSSASPSTGSQHTPLYSPGLIHYLDFLLFKSERSVLVESKFDRADCDKILEIYLVLKPQGLADVVLRSALKDYSCEKAMSVLKAQRIGKKPSRAVTLALTVVHLKECNFDSAESTLFALQEKDIVAVCLDNWHLLHTGYSQLTPLSQIIKKHKPHVFAAILNNIHVQGFIDVDTIIKLLQSATSETEVHSNIHLMLFLESILTNEGGEACLPQRTEVADLLCSIYLERILQQEERTNKSVSFLMKSFMTRWPWLNDLPPFNGEVPSNRCIHVKGTLMARVPSLPKLMPHNIPTRQDSQVVCTCWTCNQDLIKLQSVLSSNVVSPQFMSGILHVIRSHDLTGSQSLEVLCTMALSMDSGIDLIVDKYPRMVVKFAAQSLVNGNIEQWFHLIKCLSSLLRDTETKQHDDTFKEYVTAFKGVLRFMSETLPPTEFFSLLPPDVSLSFVLPCIKTSVHKHLACKLKAEMKMSDA